MAQFSTDDMALLEATIANNFEDAMMIGSLSKLQQHQLYLSERLNSILSDNVLKSQNQAAQTHSKPTATSQPSTTKTSTATKKADKWTTDTHPIKEYKNCEWIRKTLTIEE